MNQISRVTRGRLALCALLISAMLIAALASRPASAAINAVRYVAPTGVDSGNCIAAPCATITFAIGRAAPGDTISIAAGTYFDNPIIAKNVIVQGAGPNATIVDGSGIGSVFDISDPGTDVTLTGMTIQHGGNGQVGGGIRYGGTGQLSVSAANVISNTALDGGGGIYSTGHLILDGVNVLNNRTQGAQGGGGLRVVGVADVANTTIANNEAPLGGGVYNLAILNLTNVTIANNKANTSGGGIYNKNNTVTGSGGEIRNNQAGLNGGGIYSEVGDAQLMLNNMVIKDNTATNGSGGGVFNDQMIANFDKVTMSGNTAKGSGGGIFNKSGGQVTLTNTWLKGNLAQTAAGGGIYNEGTLDVTASTLSGNTAPVLQGGGISSNGSATLKLVTITGNTTSIGNGGAVYAGGGSVHIVSSTIVSNTDPGLKAAELGELFLVNSIVVDRNGGPNCSGAIASDGFNLETKNSCNFGQASDLPNQNQPGVGPLKDNGGPTPTQAIAYSSPATDNGTTDLSACQAADQRGITRPVNGRCDIGAYEIIAYGNDTTVPISANECVTSTIVINDSYAIGKLNVGVNATFDPRGDLRVNLVSPAGKRVALLGPTGGTAVNLDALFDDAAPVGVPDSGMDDTSQPYYDNVYRPYDPLSVLNNVSLKGTWTLEACSQTLAAGHLNNWLILVPEVSTSFKVYMPFIRRR